MKTIFTCAACRHLEEGDSRNGLMLKVRMWNHINHDHPELIDRFKESVHSEFVSSAQMLERQSA